MLFFSQLMCNYYTLRQDGSTAFIRSWSFQVQITLYLYPITIETYSLRQTQSIRVNRVLWTETIGRTWEYMRTTRQCASLVSLHHGLSLVRMLFFPSDSSDSSWLLLQLKQLTLGSSASVSWSFTATFVKPCMEFLADGGCFFKI